MKTHPFNAVAAPPAAPSAAATASVQPGCRASVEGEREQSTEKYFQQPPKQQLQRQEQPRQWFFRWWRQTSGVPAADPFGGQKAVSFSTGSTAAVEAPTAQPLTFATHISSSASDGDKQIPSKTSMIEQLNAMLSFRVPLVRPSSPPSNDTPPTAAKEAAVAVGPSTGSGRLVPLISCESSFQRQTQQTPPLSAAATAVSTTAASGPSCCPSDAFAPPTFSSLSSSPTHLGTAVAAVSPHSSDSSGGLVDGSSCTREDTNISSLLPSVTGKTPGDATTFSQDATSSGERCSCCCLDPASSSSCSCSGSSCVDWRALRVEQHRRRKQLQLLRHPVKTLQHFLLSVGDFSAAAIHYVALHPATAWVLVVICAAIALQLVDGPHAYLLHELNVWGKLFIWWVGLGVLSSIGLGSGMHSGLLFLFPQIYAICATADACNTLAFDARSSMWGHVLQPGQLFPCPSSSGEATTQHGGAGELSSWGSRLYAAGAALAAALLSRSNSGNSNSGTNASWASSLGIPKGVPVVQGPPALSDTNVGAAAAAAAVTTSSSTTSYSWSSTSSNNTGTFEEGYRGEVSFGGLLWKAFFPYALLWGVGTALGELPPYAASYAAARSKQADEEFEELEEELRSGKTSLVTRMKVWTLEIVQKYGALSVFLLSCWPNVLFDLCGIVCGHFMMPFYEFFIALMLGKALCKTLMQVAFFVFLFSARFDDTRARLVAAVSHIWPLSLLVDKYFGGAKQFEAFVANHLHALRAGAHSGNTHTSSSVSHNDTVIGTSSSHARESATTSILMEGVGGGGAGVSLWSWLPRGLSLSNIFGGIVAVFIFFYCLSCIEQFAQMHQKTLDEQLNERIAKLLDAHEAELHAELVARQCHQKKQHT